jgi:hypothetical protein
MHIPTALILLAATTPLRLADKTCGALQWPGSASPGARFGDVMYLRRGCVTISDENRVWNRVNNMHCGMCRVYAYVRSRL